MNGNNTHTDIEALEARMSRIGELEKMAGISGAGVEIKNVDLSAATEAVRRHFESICCGYLTFSVIASVNEPKLPYIAIRIKEHCLLEEQFRVHDVIVNRDGTIYSTKMIGIDGSSQLPAFTGK